MVNRNRWFSIDRLLGGGDSRPRVHHDRTSWFREEETRE